MTESISPPPIPRRRPRLVWAIFLFYAISGGVGLILQLEMFFGLAKFPPEQQAIVGAMSTGAKLFGFGVGIFNIIAATSLWLLRRVAFPLFSVSLLLNIGTVIWHVLPGGMYSNMYAQGALMAGVTVYSVAAGVLIAFGIWWYTLQLWRRGVLR